MSSTTYSRTSGSAILPGTWAYIQARADIMAADKLDPADRYTYDTATPEERRAFDEMAARPELEPPEFLKFNLAENPLSMAHYPGESNPLGFLANGVLADMNLDQLIMDLNRRPNGKAMIQLLRDKQRLARELAKFHGIVSLIALPIGTLVYRTIGLMAAAATHGMVTNKLLGAYWEARSPNAYENIDEWRAKTAVLAEWNGDYGHLVVELKREVFVLSGCVAQQAIHRDGHKVLPGGGMQYFIPELSNADMVSPVEGVPLVEVIHQTQYRSAS